MVSGSVATVLFTLAKGWFVMSKDMLEKLRRLSAKAPKRQEEEVKTEWEDESQEMPEINLDGPSDDSGFSWEEDEDDDSDIPDQTHRVVTADDEDDDIDLGASDDTDEDDDEAEEDGDTPVLASNDTVDTEALARRVADLVIARLRDAINSLPS